MVRSSESKTKALQESLQAKQRRKRKIIALLSGIVGGAVVIQYMAPHLIKTPMYNSKLSGEAWVQELLHGHPSCFHDNLGMSKFVFQRLVQELQIYAGLDDSKCITKEEQVAIFLHLCRTGAVTRDIRERFQHSADTISRCVLEHKLHFYTQRNLNSQSVQPNFGHGNFKTILLSPCQTPSKGPDTTRDTL